MRDVFIAITLAAIVGLCAFGCSKSDDNTADAAPAVDASANAAPDTNTTTVNSGTNDDITDNEINNNPYKGHDAAGSANDAS